MKNSSESDGDLYDEWKNKILRKSFALSSLVRVRQMKGKTLFSKGKIIEIGEFIKQNEVDAVFINCELSPM